VKRKGRCYLNTTVVYYTNVQMWLDQVYQSMVEAGCSPDLLSWFDGTKIDVLYSLRTLSAKQREVLFNPQN
jgi:hypothetical protein